MRKHLYVVAGLIFLASVLCGPGAWAADDICIASANARTWDEGDSVPCSVDLSGSQRVTIAGGSVGATSTAAAPTYIEGADNNLSMDLAGNLRTTLGTTIAGEAVADDVLKVEMRGYYNSICSSGCIFTSAGTHTLKSGPGWFQGCHVLGGTLGNVTIYDNTAASGAVVVAAFTPATADDLKSINTSFSVGLTVVTAAATNMTCVVR